VGDVGDVGDEAESGRPDGPGIWSELLDRLESEVWGMSFRTADEILATIPGYDHATREKIANTALQNLSMSTRIIMRGREPKPEDVYHAEKTALERIEEGVPLGSLLSGFRLSMHGIQRRLLSLAPEYGTPPEQLLEWSNLLWTLGDVFATRVTAVYRDHEIARTVADSTRRSEWIGRVIAGELEEAEILRGAALYEVPTDRRVRVLMSPLGGTTELDADAELRRWADRGGARLLTTVQSRAVVGILIGGVPDAAVPAGVTVALGRPAPLVDLHRTFATTGRVMRTAQELSLSGVVDQDTLSWRLALHASPETSELLRERYLTPLRDARTFGEELIMSVQVYLEKRLNVREAAASIPVHVNTLRYRLRRFEELTGCDLGEVNTLVEVAWVVELYAADRHL
jgi:putative transposase